MQLGDLRLGRLRLALGLGALLVLAVVGSGFDPADHLSLESWGSAASFLGEWWPPRADREFLTTVGHGVLDTLATALLGTLLAAGIALPIALLGSRLFTRGARYASGDARRSRVLEAAFLAARASGAFFRSVPEVLWALVFVHIQGPGALPAIAALGIAYGGMLGKVWSEQIEAVEPAPIAALESLGASRGSAFLWGTLPQAFPGMLDYGLYRFECAVRASILMGFVGAEGLGMHLQISSEYYRWGEVCTEIAALVLVVVAIEMLADRMRRAAR